ncbi:protein-tyrosine phosphatase [Propionicimonas paludicola]|uniref:protein-tyrosine-phosphatase n=1 Tax=Propionicimonas paludicola TaxID=185243 RepID=A0A2A9CV58_9ACTN|nr:low molecular weight protein-tyrosine-phosphatase [Propionicimonas paludicola]PFG18317.1 protein-tyrosine phosphatase [Propionicimonas paludicola]
MSQPVICFVCWGNICRSPMAQVVAEARAAYEQLRGVQFTSAGVSSEEQGNPMDPRAIAVLRANGYSPGMHSAHQITPDEIRSAAMLIGMEPLHLSRIRQVVSDATNLYLMSDFIPAAEPGSSIEDPWYGDDSDFKVTLEQIQSAMPEVIRRARELASGRA